MCVDSGAIKNITINKYPILRLDDILDERYGSSILFKVDLWTGYHQIQLEKGDK